MSNGAKGKSSFDESMEVLKKFCKDVNEKSPIQGNNELSGKANDALTNWDNFVKPIDYLKLYINPTIFDNDKDIKNLKDKRSDIDLNLHDSLKVIIDLYTDVCNCKTHYFNDEELQKVRKSLEHQINIVERMKNFALEIGAEGVCGRRPRLPLSLPAES